MRLQHLVTTVLILVTALLAIWAVTTWTWAADWTHANRHSLTQASKRLLDAMPRPITFTAYAYPGPERQTIRNALARYRRYDDSIRLHFVNPARRPQTMRRLDIDESGVVRVGYEGRHQVVKDLTEQEITSALQRVSMARAQKVVFITGHGERDPGESASSGYSQLRNALEHQGMTVQTANLAQTAEIPANTTILVLASPQHDLLSSEADTIREYIADGGNLLWLADPSTVGGLPGLAKQLGIKWLPGLVINPDYQAQGLLNAAAFKVSRGSGHAVTRHLNNGKILFSFAGGVAPNPHSDWQTQPIIKTRQDSQQANQNPWLETGSLQQSRLHFNPNKDKAGPITIGMVLVRQQPQTDAAHKTQRAVVMADSTFLTNSAFIRSGHNRDFGTNLFQWLSYRDQQISVNTPTPPDAHLHLVAWQARTVWLVYVMALPLLLLGIGTGRWWLRRRR